MTKSKKIAVLLLAAGESKRLGQPKQLLKDKNSVTLIERIIKTVSAAQIAENIYVVTGAKHDSIENAIEKFNKIIIRNEQWREGIGASIKRGIEFIEQNDDQAQGVLIVLCDQPFISPEHLQTIYNTFHKNANSIVCTTYGAVKGVPAIFCRKFFDALKSLEGDVGARHVIKKNLSDVVEIRFEKAAFDIDSAESFEQFLRSD